ncbi:hypothetical protein Taro_054530 [Colocasia esculenta]|uniref:Putative plant transposon protein domain-containing protein n=1 Tax=Colocasia esculenta TaxID=4460 RepID=A0A843XNR8_COLES|nr:hypothetical protein [Colocasia esculenta]
MARLVDALRRLQWMDVVTFNEVSYPDLVKAFYICLKSEADGSLVSSVKGIQIRITHELLRDLFGVKTSGFSGIHSVNDEVKGLGIIGPGVKLKDGNINQMSAFNRLLHFIVCQIIVPRSATFSSCTRADSDIMFWAIQNKEINLATVMIERMMFAHAQLWETKSKLNVSLPYAHLLTKIFKHYGVDMSGAVAEKMGQSIRSRNLKKSGFSVQDGVWTKSSVAEGEPVIGDIPEEQEAAAEEEAATAEQAAAAEEEAEAAEQEPVESAAVEVPVVESQSEDQLEVGAAGVADSLPTTLVASILREVLDSIPSTLASSKEGGCVEEEVMAPGHSKVQSEQIADVEIQAGTQQNVVLEEAPSQGEQSRVEPEVSESVAAGHLEKVVLEEAPAQGEHLSVEVPAPIQGEQAEIEKPENEDVSSIRNAMRYFNKELSDMKTMLGVFSKSSGMSPGRPAAPRPPGPAGPSAQGSGPSGPSVVRSPGPVAASGSSGPSPAVRESQAKGKEPVSVSKAPDTSSLATPTLSTPSSTSTAPPTPPTIKHPMPRTQPTSSSISSQPSFSPTPSHISAPSSLTPKPSPPKIQTPPLQPTSFFNPKHLFYPPTPPNSVIFPPDKPLPLGVFDTNVPDHFERNTLLTILSTASHIHRTDPPSPAKKKRKTSSSISQAFKSKIFEGAEFKTEDQWAAIKGNKAQYEKYLTARAESLTHRAHPLTFSEWFIIQHKNSWGSFILKEIRIARSFQLYSDFCYLNKIPEVQFCQFHSKITVLKSELPLNLPLKVDFVTCKVDFPVLLPKLHSLVFDSDAGSHALDMFARQMGRMSAKQGRSPSFLRFIFREYHSGRISSQTLAPLISECERLTSSEWEILYQASYQQLEAINTDLVSQRKPTLSAEAFMDLNSIIPIQEIYVVWASRYSAFYALKQDLLNQKIHYPISLDRFLHRASFGKSTYYRFILDKTQYGEFLEQQRQLYIQRNIPSMGPSFSVASGNDFLFDRKTQNKSISQRLFKTSQRFL